MPLRSILLMIGAFIAIATANNLALPALSFQEPQGGFFQTIANLSSPTIAMWVKPISPSNGRQVIFYLGNIDENGIGLWIQANSGNLVLGVGSSFFDTNVALTNRWTFVQLATNPHPMLFIDGFLAVEYKSVQYKPASVLYIGSGSVNSSPFYGGIDEVQVWESTDLDDSVFRWRMMVGLFDVFSPQLKRYFGCELQYYDMQYSILERASSQMVPVLGNVVQTDRQTSSISVCPFYPNCSRCLGPSCSWCPDTSSCIESGTQCSVGMAALTCASPNTTNMIIIIATTCGTAVLVIVVVVPAVVVTKQKRKRKSTPVRLATLPPTETRDARDVTVHSDDHTFAGTRNWIVLKDHNAEDKFELSVKRGAKVFVASAENKLFWIVRSATSEVGLVPKEILSPCNS